MRLGRVLLLLLTTSSVSHAAEFYVLDPLPGDDSTRAAETSHTGAYAVGYSWRVEIVDGEVVTEMEAFRWDAINGAIGLGDLPGGLFRSSANDISGDGTVVVGNAQTESGIEAFRWTKGTGLVGLGQLPGYEYSYANSISADGRVIVGLVGSEDYRRTQSFRWTEETGMVGLGFIGEPPTRNSAWSVSADGSVIVGSTISTPGGEAFIWTEETGMVGLGVFGGMYRGSNGYGVSRNGRFVVGRTTTDEADEGFIWSLATGMKTLGAFPSGATSSSGGDVSDDGATIVGHSRADDRWIRATIWGETRGLRWLEDDLSDRGLNLTGWRLTSARSLSPDGNVIAGWGHRTTPEMGREYLGWVATLEGSLPLVVDICIESRPSARHKSPKMQAVAILGSQNFDIEEIDRRFLLFGPEGADPIHRHDGHERDINRDGYMDLVSHYTSEDAGIDHEDTNACINGKLHDGAIIDGCAALPAMNQWGKKRHALGAWKHCQGESPGRGPD